MLFIMVHSVISVAIAEDAMKGGKGGKSKDSAEKPELGPPPEEGMIYK